MCGIAGYLLKRSRGSVQENMDALMGPLRKRGPDDEGVVLIDTKNRDYKSYCTESTVDPVKHVSPHIIDAGSLIEHDLALFHTRYSIIDLSAGGHQPFASSDGRVIAVFNGEIYNYIELKDELSAMGVSFRTDSDTEVLVEGYRKWENDLWPKMNGFWAVAIYDNVKGELCLARDRIGVAPLYYAETEEGLYFSSYIQSLLNIGGPSFGPYNDVIEGFLQTGIKDHDHTTFYQGIKTVPEASCVRIGSGQCSVSGADVLSFWNLPSRRLKPDELSFDDAVEEYRDIFFRAVELRLRADVKVAFELSGGLDSSSVVAAAAMLKNNDITTYTAKIKGADEEPYARSILKKYPVDYRVLAGIEEDFISDFGGFSNLMEEPYDNPNDYTHNRMLEQMKAEGVHVVVTGAGGDEVFAGYEASFWPKAYREWRSMGGMDFWRADWYEFCRRFKTLKTSCETLRHYFVDAVPRIVNADKKNVPKHMVQTAALGHLREYSKMSFHEQSIYHFKVALVPYYMRSSDHFTMGIPIEHRFPFLDYRMVEFGLMMPVSYLFRNGWTKYILRKAMEPYLPRKIIWRRKKMGFRFPYRKFFSKYRIYFKPLIEDLRKIGVRGYGYGDYDELLKTDPALLWRILSTAIWVRYNLKK